MGSEPVISGPDRIYETRRQELPRFTP